MSETTHFLWIAKNQTPERIDWYLNTLVAAGIDCYSKGSVVLVNPDQWEEAIDALREAEYESLKVNV